MARYILDHNVQKLDELTSFDLDGYQFSADLSDKEQLVFVR